MKIEECALPGGSLIAPFGAAEGHYADCFEVAVAAPVALPAFIHAFYTQPLFKAERLVLRVVAGARSSDAEARALADGETDRFAVWSVKDRRADELLMADASGRTMSWLGVGTSVLRFGSVIVPVPDRRGRLTLGPVFQSLMGAHKFYSRALLAGAARRVSSGH
ncbi:MAG: hypothetical protein AAFP16_08595 [Pseudomonadota bacterium]